MRAYTSLGRSVVARTLEYITKNPGCTVTEIERGADISDVAATWGYLIDLEGDGLIKSAQDASGKWHFNAI